MAVQGRMVAWLLLLGVLTACSPRAGQRVSFMVFGDPAELAAYEALVAAFEETRPEIDVELRHIPEQADYRRRLAAEFSSGAPPDVMLLNYRRFATFAEQGGLAPLDTYLAESENIRAEDFFEVAVEGFRLNGRLWCIPQNISSLVVYYNQDLFDAAGVAYPTDGWTWDDFLATARALTQDIDGDGRTDIYGLGTAPNIFRLAPFLWQQEVELVDDPQHPTRLALDDPQALDVFRWFVGLQTREGVVPDAIAEASETSESRFLNGRLGMYLNSRRGVPTYRTIQDFTWNVAPLPVGRVPAGILHSDGFCMAAAAENKAAAWAFIEFANSVDGQSIVARSGRTVPSLRVVAESPAFLDPDAAPANSRVFVDTVRILRRVPLMTTWSAIEDTASREIERAFYGRASVEEAAAAAIEYTQPFFERAGSAP